MYDPAGGTKPAKALKKITALGFSPKQHTAVGVIAQAKAIKAQGRAKTVATKAGQQADLVFSLFPRQGYSLDGQGKEATVVSVSAPKGITPPAPVTITEIRGKQKKLSLKLDVGKSTKAGTYTVSVKVRFRALKGKRSQGVKELVIEIPLQVK